MDNAGKITKEDAISRQAVLNLAKKGVLVSNGNYESVCKAINEIPAVNLMPCEDAISREDAEQMFRNIRSHLKPQDYKSAEEFNTRDLMLLNAEQMIHALPSVTQKSGVEPQESDHKCHTCKHYTSGGRDGSCGSYICKEYSNWESEDEV